MVAVTITSEEVARLVQAVLEDDGFRAVIAYVETFGEGREGFAAFLHRRDSALIVADFAMPYEENSYGLQRISGGESVAGRGLMLTTANTRALEMLVGTT